MFVYAANAATTAMSKAAVDAMVPCLQEFSGNPSSLHTPGQLAAERLAAEQKAAEEKAASEKAVQEAANKRVRDRRKR
jgi:cysteine desulfurase